MAWNPDIYNKFKTERFLPFYDLLALLRVRQGMDVIDLGCGTGELTSKLADELAGSMVLGIDSSREMLNDSKAFERGDLRFECRSIEEQLRSGAKWDLVFSNAAIQWVPDHQTLLPEIIAAIKPDGQLLVQIPSQHHNISNRLLNELAEREPFKTSLQNWARISPVLDIESYAQLLFENGGSNITVYEKVYPIVMANTDALFDWVSGTAIIPYLGKLENKNQQYFIEEYKKLLSIHFTKSPVFYPFKRIIIAATF